MRAHSDYQNFGLKLSYCVMALFSYLLTLLALHSFSSIIGQTSEKNYMKRLIILKFNRNIIACVIFAWPFALSEEMAQLS